MRSTRSLREPALRVAVSRVLRRFATLGLHTVDPLPSLGSGKRESGPLRIPLSFAEGDETAADDAPSANPVLFCAIGIGGWRGIADLASIAAALLYLVLGESADSDA